MGSGERPDRGRAAARPDWVFIGFVAFAVVVSAFVETRRVQLHRAIERTASCLALADTACAERGLDDARSLDADDVRVRIADADEQILLGDTGKASVQLAKFDTTEAALDPEAHGDLLLARGDLAAAMGDEARARALYAAAQSLVRDDTLVEARGSRLSAAAARQKTAWGALRDRVEQLFTAAQAGEIDTVNIRQKDLGTEIAGLKNPAAREKLTLAMNAAQRAAAATRTAKNDAVPTSPLASPEPPLRSGLPDRIYQAQLESYERRLQAYQKYQASMQEGHDKRVGAQNAIASENLTQARQLLDEAMALLSSPSGQAAP